MNYYLSINAATTPDDVRFLSKIFSINSFALGCEYEPAIGYAVTTRTLSRTPQERRYVKLNDLPVMLTISTARNVIHYRADDKENLSAELHQLLRGLRLYDNGLCRRVQLNNGRRVLHQLPQIKEEFPELAIIMPLHPRIHPENLEKVARKAQYIDAVLLDNSYGQGHQLDIAIAHKAYEQIRPALPGIPVGFAGGFNQYNIERIIADLRIVIPESFSLDAESGVRYKMSAIPEDDLLNFSEAEAFIRKSGRRLLNGAQARAPAPACHRRGA